MSSVDHFTPAKSAGAGVVLSAANPKNLVLAAAAAAEIAQFGLWRGRGRRLRRLRARRVDRRRGAGRRLLRARRAGRTVLDGLKTWMGRNNAVIMAVLLLVIGAKLVGDAIAGFSS